MELETGDKVVLCSLVIRPTLNGKNATLLAIDGGRWCVDVGGEKIKVRPENVTKPATREQLARLLSLINGKRDTALATSELIDDAKAVYERLVEVPCWPQHYAKLLLEAYVQ